MAERPADVTMAVQKLAPYWDEWAKSHGGESAEALNKVRSVLGR